MFGMVLHANNTLFLSFNICKVDFKKLPQATKRTSRKMAKMDKLFMIESTFDYLKEIDVKGRDLCS